MVTKAYVIEQSKTNSNLYKIRIPCLHGISGGQHATPDKELPYAQVITLPAASNVVHPGDCVLVGFDTNDEGVPVILGHLFTENYNNEPIDLTLRRLNFDDRESMRNVCVANLPYNTTIGDITKDNLNCLKGLNMNVQQAFQGNSFQMALGNTEAYNPKKYLPNTEWECLGKLSTVGDYDIYLWHKEG